MKVPVKARDTLQKAIHALQKNPNAAVERYIDKALELYPHYSNALALRAVVERDIYPEQAAVDAEKAVEYDSSYGPGYVALGSVYVGLGRLDDAVRTLDYAIAINPNAWQGYYEMSRALLGKRDYAAALHQIQKACSLARQNYPFLHFQKAQILIGMSNASAAIVELEAYLREEPNGQVSPEARRDLDRLRAAWRHD
jgi:tetratricopeptide (TPR) repeat protein